MLGLGWMELLVIGGALMLIAGPAAAPKLLRGLQSLRGARGLDKLTKVNEALEALGGERAKKEHPESEDADAPRPR
jgi:Sec-independent protein translocase protein TatA